MAKTALKEVKTDSKTRSKAQPDAASEDSAPPRKKRGSLKRVLVTLLLLGAAAGSGAWYFLQEHEPAAPAKPGAAKGAAVNKTAPSKPPVFLPLDMFTVNLQRDDDAAAQYLQVGLSLKVSNDKAIDEVKLRMPEVRNRVLLLLANKKASEISSSEQKQALSTELMREISQPLAGGPAASAMESVLFTSFVVQ